MKKLAILLLSLVTAAACTTLVTGQEDLLTKAGFQVQQPDTPERQALLQNLAPRQFVRNFDGSDTTFTYADPDVCKCLYVGSADAYTNYLRLTARTSGSATFGNPTNNGYMPTPTLDR